MTNISWIRPRTCCSSISLISGRRGSHNSIPIVRHINFDHFTTTVSYNVYLPWWNSNHSYMQHQQIAQFCKKTKRTKETALASTTSPTNTGTNTSTTIAAEVSSTSATNASTISSTKSIRRKKKDQRTNVSTASNDNQTMILIPLSEQHHHDSNVRSTSSSITKDNSRNLRPASSGGSTGISSTSAITMTSVYVHPLSQMVLQCLQANCHEWVQSKNLHTNLTIHSDGTFVTKSAVTTTTTKATKSQQSTLMIRDDVIDIPNRTVKSRKDSTDSIKETNYNHAKNIIKIWTTYEKVERKHWLCASVANDDNRTANSNSTIGNGSFEEVGLIHNRYMLQDNSLTPWQSYSKVRGSIPERIQTHVHEMIQAINAVTGEP